MAGCFLFSITWFIRCNNIQLRVQPDTSYVIEKFIFSLLRIPQLAFLLFFIFQSDMICLINPKFSTPGQGELGKQSPSLIFNRSACSFMLALFSRKRFKSSYSKHIWYILFSDDGLNASSEGGVRKLSSHDQCPRPESARF